MHPNSKIQELARKHYNEDPKTKELVDRLFASGRVLEEPIYAIEEDKD